MNQNYRKNIQDSEIPQVPDLEKAQKCGIVKHAL